MHGDAKQQVTAEWIERFFGSAKAWQRSLTRFQGVCVGRKRREAIHIRLVHDARPTWRLPCPEKPLAANVRAAVAGAVLGFGPRPRVAYRVGEEQRVAVGRKGESSDRLRAELVRIYGPVWTADVSSEDGAVAEYVATGGSYRPHARRLGMRDQRFLAKASDPVEVERAAVLDDRQFERVWRMRPVYAVPSGPSDVSLGDPGEWAADADPVVIADPGGRPEEPPPLPMAVPKADGRGRHNLYFGFALDVGGGARWNERDFEPPLRIALGGLLNRQLGFGNSTGPDEVLPYQGDGFHWGRNKPLALRVVDVDRGPACRVLVHPEPEGWWYSWLAASSPVPSAIKWDAWMRRATVYERQRKKAADREAKRLADDPPCSGDVSKAA